MQRTDLVLVLLAVVAVVATAVAVAGSARWTGEHTVRFEETSTALVAQGPTDVGTAGTTFEWLVPDNATSATLQVAVTFSGQAVQGGSATVNVRVTGPDGQPAGEKTVALAIAGGATSATAKIDLNVSWADVPASVRDARGNEPSSLHWAAPLKVLVVASRPSDLPVANYGFAASASGTVTSYHAA